MKWNLNIKEIGFIYIIFVWKNPQNTELIEWAHFLRTHFPVRNKWGSSTFPFIYQALVEKAKETNIWSGMELNPMEIGQ